MGYDIPLGYSRCTFKFSAIGASGSKPVFGFGTKRLPSQELVDDLAALWADSFQANTYAAYFCESVEARDNFNVNEAVIADNGEHTGTVAAPNTCALVKLSSGFSGRSNRGRIYLPGMVGKEEIVDSGEIIEAAVTRIQSVIDDLVLYLGDGETGLYILHSTELEPTSVATANVEVLAATQRRRMRR